MAWTSLNALILTQAGDYSPLPTGAAGREITIRLPAFPAGETGTYKIGIYSGTAQNPALIADATALIAPYQRHLRFQVPSNTFGILLGVQLLTHEDLENAIFDLVPEVLITQEEGSGANFPGALPMALTLAQVVELVGARLSANYATYEEFAELLTGVELSVISLRQALELEIEGISLTAGPKGDTGDVGPKGDTGELPTEALNTAIANLRSELEMIGQPFQHSAAAGVAALVIIPPPPEGFCNVILSVDFSYGGPQAQLAGVFSITESSGTVTRHRSAVTSTGTGPFFKGIRCGAGQAVTVTLSAIAGYTANINGAFRLEAI